MVRDSRRLAEARKWGESDPDPETRLAWTQFLASATDEEVLARMIPLEFGTAGLRAALGPGPACMNEGVVRQASHAVSEVVASLLCDGERRQVLVGYDARNRSRFFAEVAAGVFAARGIEAMLFEESVPTPLAAYALRHFRASAAVVITASHNPPEYNGFKVYDSSASPIAQQWEQAIAERFREAPPAVDIPVLGAAERSGGGCGSTVRTEEFFEDYLTEVMNQRAAAGPAKRVRIVYTPLHGVAGRYALGALERAGHRDVDVVKEQFVPDGAFPTVTNPNPEDMSALKLAITQAQASRADLVLANDPDGDRLAVVTRSTGGDWTRLSGNSVGVLLADYLLSHSGAGEKNLVVSTVVSTPMAKSVARKYGARLEQTLTGFKWLWAAARELSESEGYRPVIAFEEAIGYSVGSVVRDKDGISAAVLVADMAAAEAARGRTLVERLQDLEREHGLWVSSAQSWDLYGAEGAARTRLALDALVERPPVALAGRSVERCVDWRRDVEGHPDWLQATPMVELCINGGRVLVRPSGTEPKLKAYVDYCADAAGVSEEQRGKALRIARSVLADLGRFLELD